MHIVVCLKQVLDPEVPPRAFGLDASGRRPVVTGAPAAQVMDSYSENALELAIQLRDRTPGSRVTAAVVGDPAQDDVLRRAFAFTADAAIRAWDPGWTELDGLAVAHVLGRAIRAAGAADLVLCGRQSADLEGGIVGPALAEELELPCITLGRRLELGEGAVRVERDADGFVETLEAALPALVTVTSSESNVPRMPRIKDVMMAGRKPIRVLGAADLGLDAERVVPGARLERLHLPAAGGTCEMIPGAEPAALAAALARRLRELKLV